MYPTVYDIIANLRSAPVEIDRQYARASVDRPNRGGGGASR